MTRLNDRVKEYTDRELSRDTRWLSKRQRHLMALSWAVVTILVPACLCFPVALVHVVICAAFGKRDFVREYWLEAAEHECEELDAWVCRNY